MIDAMGLLVGHLVGDYILQNDWMVSWKNKKSGTMTEEEQDAYDSANDATARAALRRWPLIRPDVACILHCVIYTLSIYFLTFMTLPLGALLLIGAAHYPFDRWRLAYKSMQHMGQIEFSKPPLAPWSVISVDNTWHVLILYLIATFVHV